MLNLTLSKIFKFRIITYKTFSRFGKYEHSLKNNSSSSGITKIETGQTPISSNKKKIIESNMISYQNIKEPEEYRTVFLENLPKHWNEDDIRVRLEQIGIIEKYHLIKNPLGKSTGNVLAVYDKIDSVVKAINTFNNKYPNVKPVNVRFFKEKLFKPIKYDKLSQNIKSNVLLIKNIPSDLPKEDLKLFLSEFKEPINICYPRDHEDNFKRIAYVYYLNETDAEYVLKYANLRYVKNKQIFVQFSVNHWDITDFRIRIELGVQLNPHLEIVLFEKQIQDLKKKLQTRTGNIAAIQKENEKLYYLQARLRNLEFQLESSSQKDNQRKSLTSQTELNLISNSQNDSKKPRNQNKPKITYNSDKSMIFYNQ